jgi:5-methyltetrahydrofolate corrinoid/iron sulfur protein methyltransferase
MKIIGELINNSYARARRAWNERSIEGYQHLAEWQAELCVDFLTINLDGTQSVTVKMQEMLDFVPKLIPAIQEVTSVPLSFDNPSIDFHRAALASYDRSRGGQPILNSLAASREHLDEMVDLVREHDTLVIVMASEKFEDGRGAQSLDPKDSYDAVKHFVDLLVDKADRTLDQIIIDPGLAPVGADTYGLVNIGLDTMKLIKDDPDLNGIHFSVGLSNFAWGVPKEIRHPLERAYLAIACELGLDYVLANPEKDPTRLPGDDPLVIKLREALEQGRPRDGESQEDAGFRQAEFIMGICRLDDD